MTRTRVSATLQRDEKGMTAGGGRRTDRQAHALRLAVVDPRPVGALLVRPARAGERNVVHAADGRREQDRAPAPFGERVLPERAVLEEDGQGRRRRGRRLEDRDDDRVGAVLDVEQGHPERGRVLEQRRDGVDAGGQPGFERVGRRGPAKSHEEGDVRASGRLCRRRAHPRPRCATAGALPARRRRRTRAQTRRAGQRATAR